MVSCWSPWLDWRGRLGSTIVVGKGGQDDEEAARLPRYLHKATSGKGKTLMGKKVKIPRNGGEDDRLGGGV